MNNDEKLIVMRGFGASLVKEAGVIDGIVRGAKVLAGHTAKAYNTGTMAAKGSFSAANGAFDKTKVGLKNVAGHIGKFKGTYGLAAGGAITGLSMKD